MNARFKIDQAAWSRVEVGLKNIGLKLPQHAARTTRRAAERIVQRAKNYVPEDTEALKDSIRVEAEVAMSSGRKRLFIRVVAGGQAIVNVAGRTINLDQYAAIIHEAYEHMLVYGPGEKTEAKMQQFPGKVGSRFLTRAADEEAEALDRALREAVTEVIQTELPR